MIKIVQRSAECKKIAFELQLTFQQHIKLLQYFSDNELFLAKEAETPSPQ